MNGITKETFERFDTDSKLNVLFDCLTELHSCSCDHGDKLQELKEKYEQRKRFDTSVSGVTGVLGGLLGLLLSKLVGWK